MGKTKNNTLLWRISRSDLPYVSYVFGTMHVKDKKAFGGIDFIERTILECHAFAAEFNLEDLDQSLIDQNLTLDNMLLSGLIKPKLYQKLSKLVRRATGLEMQMIDNKTPFFIISLLTESLFQSEMQVALDGYLFNFAKKHQKELKGIENFSEQIEVLKKIKLSEQLKALVWIIKNFKSFKRQHQKAAALYQKQDINRLFKAVKKSAKGMRKVLLYDRNKLMTSRIAAFADEQSIFCAIGAGHLAGEKGVLRLLKQKGFKVRPIRMDSK